MIELPQRREENGCSMAAEVLRSCGEVRLQVRGTSMLPTLWPRDRLTIQSTQFEPVLPGDIVLYARQDRLFIHRVTQKSDRAGSRFLVTRGDAMAEADPPVLAAELLGKVISVHRCGNVIEPDREFSVSRCLVGMLLCNSGLLRGMALRLHAWRVRSGQSDVVFRLNETAME